MPGWGNERSPAHSWNGLEEPAPAPEAESFFGRGHGSGDRFLPVPPGPERGHTAHHDGERDDPDERTRQRGGLLYFFGKSCVFNFECGPKLGFAMPTGVTPV